MTQDTIFLPKNRVPYNEPLSVGIVTRSTREQSDKISDGSDINILRTDTILMAFSTTTTATTHHSAATTTTSTNSTRTVIDRVLLLE